MTPYEEASNYLLTNLETVCSHLFPGGKREGANFIVGSIAGQAGRSFSIALEPPTKRGLYKDFANGDKGSRNLPKLWKIVRGIPEDNHARFFQDLSPFAGMSFGWDTQGGSSNGRISIGLVRLIASARPTPKGSPLIQSGSTRWRLLTGCTPTDTSDSTAAKSPSRCATKRETWSVFTGGLNRKANSNSFARLRCL